MAVVGVDHIACSCKRIAAQTFGSQMMALPVAAYSRGAPLCRFEDVVEVVLENSLVISPLSCCVKKIHSASLGSHRGVGQMGAASAPAAGEIIHSSCFLLHHSSWRVASESRSIHNRVATMGFYPSIHPSGACWCGLTWDRSRSLFPRLQSCR
jgi:hypothetical protein